MIVYAYSAAILRMSSESPHHTTTLLEQGMICIDLWFAFDDIETCTKDLTFVQRLCESFRIDHRAIITSECFPNPTRIGLHPPSCNVHDHRSLGHELEEICIHHMLGLWSKSSSDDQDIALLGELLPILCRLYWDRLLLNEPVVVLLGWSSGLRAQVERFRYLEG